MPGEHKRYGSGEKAPNPKRPSSREIPNTKRRAVPWRAFLELGYWSFSGAWMLVLGAFQLAVWWQELLINLSSALLLIGVFT
jgi:hypothetical protein